jgi:hypothetical protein
VLVLVVKHMSKETVSTIEQKASNYALRADMTEAEFNEVTMDYYLLLLILG